MKIFRDNIKFSFETRKLWWFTATSRTRARFARTALGSFWLGFSNLLSITTLGIVYGTVFSVTDFNSYLIYLGIGLVVWNAICSSISSAPILFINNRSNIQNLKLKPIFYVFEEWAFQVQTFFQSFVLVFLVLLFFNKSLFYNLIVSSWIPFVNLFIFLFWFPLIIALISLRFSDFAQLVPIVLQLIFLISPILYRKESLGDLNWITNINFFYILIDSLRYSLITSNVNYLSQFLILIINIVGLILSLLILHFQAKKIPFLV
ncbi:ABC transporter permease [Prochlorococcus marinus]|uniref:ABC transporter permease n=1 Tax=Prochlorococcus marinus TaxID=1219 RepID=UPI0039AFB6C4